MRRCRILIGRYVVGQQQIFAISDEQHRQADVVDVRLLRFVAVHARKASCVGAVVTLRDGAQVEESSQSERDEDVSLRYSHF